MIERVFQVKILLRILESISLIYTHGARRTNEVPVRPSGQLVFEARKSFSSRVRKGIDGGNRKENGRPRKIIRVEGFS